MTAAVQARARLSLPSLNISLLSWHLLLRVQHSGWHLVKVKVAHSVTTHSGAELNSPILLRESVRLLCWIYIGCRWERLVGKELWSCWTRSWIWEDLNTGVTMFMAIQWEIWRRSLHSVTVHLTSLLQFRWVRQAGFTSTDWILFNAHIRLVFGKLFYGERMHGRSIITVLLSCLVHSILVCHMTLCCRTRASKLWLLQWR